MNRKKFIVIVDAYSSGALLAPALHKLDYGTIHIQTQKQIADIDINSFKPENFHANIIYDNEENVISALNNFNIAHIICGSESGVVITERLAKLLGHSTNDPDTSFLRRNKFSMIEALHKHNIPAARQRLCKNRTDAYQFALEENKLVVLKPLKSGASDDIMFCKTPDEAAKAFDIVTSHHDIFGNKNDSVVIQSYLDGHEYYVNTVSLNGIHHVAEFWKITHIAINGLHKMQDSSLLLSGKGEIQKKLTDYSFKCLDALGIQNGPAHLEIKYGTEGPKLIELGARICGGSLGRVASKVLKESQMDIAIKALHAPDKFLSEAGNIYELKGTVAITALLSTVSGTLKSYPNLDKLQSLESFEELIKIVPEGNAISPTINDATYPLMVVLKHNDAATVERDSRTIRHIDGENFYEIFNTI